MNMDDQTLQLQIDEINRKLDLVLTEIEHQRRHRQEMEDLKEDLTRVGNDLFRTAIVELEGVQSDLETGDIVYLGKKLLRNVKNITRTIEQLESARDFLTDFSPILRELILDFMKTLDELDRKGYFQFLSEVLKVGDRIVTSFSAEDVKNLGDNIVTILNTVKNLTQPDMLHTVNNALNVYKNLDFEVKENVSTVSLLRELTKPEMKRSLLFAMQFLKSVSNQQYNSTTPAMLARNN